MRRFVCFLAITVAAFAQTRTQRKVFSSPDTVDKSVNAPSDYVPDLRHTRAANAKATPLASTTPQAPGVLQVDLGDFRRSSWFVSTDAIPSGSTVAAFIIPPG